jgi:timeless
LPAPQLEEEDAAPRFQEAAFDLRKRLRQELAAPAVLHFYVTLLKGYKSCNSWGVNHALCGLLWRVVLPDQLDLEPLLYQLSVLRVFHTVRGYL